MLALNLAHIMGNITHKVSLLPLLACSMFSILDFRAAISLAYLLDLASRSRIVWFLEATVVSLVLR